MKHVLFRTLGASACFLVALSFLSAPSAPGSTVDHREFRGLMGACVTNANTNERICYGGDCQSGGCGCTSVPNLDPGNAKAKWVTTTCGTAQCTTGHNTPASTGGCDG
jgi:hypothetical protein